MINVKVTDGHHLREEFQSPNLPGIGDVLTIVKGDNTANCYTVIRRGYTVFSDAGADLGSVADITLLVRKSTNVEESFRVR